MIRLFSVKWTLEDEIRGVLVPASSTWCWKLPLRSAHTEYIPDVAPPPVGHRSPREFRIAWPAVNDPRAIDDVRI